MIQQGIAQVLANRQNQSLPGLTYQQVQNAKALVDAIDKQSGMATLAATAEVGKALQEENKKKNQASSQLYRARKKEKEEEQKRQAKEMKDKLESYKANIAEMKEELEGRRTERTAIDRR
jgi:seryl-tRNA synthetase